MASLVDAIRKILDKYNNLGQYRLLFGTWMDFSRIVPE